MKRHLALFIFFAGLAAQAAGLQPFTVTNAVPDEAAPTEVNHFQAIVDLAKSGKALTFKEAEGVYSGRCYDPFLHKSSAVSAVLGVFKTSGCVNGKCVVQNWVIPGMGDGKEDEFDHTPRNVLISKMLPLRTDVAKVIDAPLGMDIHTRNPEGPSYIRVEFFRNGQYMLATARFHEILPADPVKGTPAKEWFSPELTACYYFFKR